MAAPDAFWQVPFKPTQALPSPDNARKPTVIQVEDDGNVVPFRRGNDDSVRITRYEDGGAFVDLSDAKVLDHGQQNDEFSANLAEMMDGLDLSRISEDLLEGIDADLRSRDEWVTNRDRAIDLLGLKIENPRASPGGGGAPLQGMSTAKDPVLLEAVIRGQANAIGEFLPAEGPAKIQDVGDIEQDKLAGELQKTFNYFLTDVATEYYPDSKQMFAWCYFGGSGFKKVYPCPLRRRPVSESVDAKDLVVSNAATDLMNADRVTHIVELRRSQFRRLVVAGMYVDDVASVAPTAPDRNRLDEKIESITGTRSDSTRPEDQPYTIYECRCELEIEWDRFMPKKFKDRGVPLPYTVSIEKDSRRIIAIYRDWDQDDEDAKRTLTFVRYCYIDWMGFYGIGLLHVMGNLAMALTAMLRIAIDNGMFSNFPGGLTLKQAGQKQQDNEKIAGPGQFVGIDGGGLQDIRQIVMAMPYGDIKQGLMLLMDKTREVCQRIGSTADLPVAEGRADVPVGTILALIEQASKVESAVHKGMHTSQALEFKLLIDLFRKDPEALYRHQKKAKKKGGTSTWNEQLVLQALNDYDLVPKSDPNTPSQLHRVMKAVAILQMAQSAPQAFNMSEVFRFALEVLGEKTPDRFLAPAPSGPAPPDPKLIEANAKMIEATTKQTTAQGTLANKDKEIGIKAAEIKGNQDVADTRLAQELVIHAADREKAQGDFALKAADHHLKAQGQQADNTFRAQEHSLNLKNHALDARSAAHDAAVDVAELNKPEPAPSS